MSALVAGTAAPAVEACSGCLRRTWLVARLAGRIETERRGRRTSLALLLALDDERLMAAVHAPRDVAREREAFDPARARSAIERAGLSAACRHAPRYPAALRELPDAPAVLHATAPPDAFAELTAPERPLVAVVGARRATGYGLEVARALGRGLAAAGVPVVSGLALGIDASAHAGAVEAGGPTIAVLAGGADRPYPASKHALHAAVRRCGAVVSELPPGAGAQRWSFPARNRIIAGLARVTVVVEAAERSGSLITAEFARDQGREVAAVPGRVTSPLAAGTNALLQDGAALVRGPEDVLDLVHGVGQWSASAVRPPAPAHLAPLLTAVAAGQDTLEALADAGHEVGRVLAGLAELELLGHLRADPGGRYVAAS